MRDNQLQKSERFPTARGGLTALMSELCGAGKKLDEKRLAS